MAKMVIHGEGSRHAILRGVNALANTVKVALGRFGFDAETGEYGDMIEAGIIDPAKVVRTALEHAAAIASLVLTTETLVCEAA